MVSRVLIANRGEIARRIIRACRQLGLPSVAVYSDADADLPFVTEADTAVRIGPASPRDSYLKIDALIEALRETGADAVHPGYGFLAESAAFAEAVNRAGAVWIGPAADTIRAMGDKERARDIARRAGVPVVPGSARFVDAALDGLEAAGERVGYPLLVKAPAGGGGIGMQRVDDPASLREAAEATHSMAAKAFGDGAVFLERFIPKARHVEIQVFGDGKGEGIHLYERDCSLQRRYQKVIEESPAPGLSDGTRAEMAGAAVALVKATSYAGAGTVEFIVDATTGAFFFLEMNTRIQVEHPVTEMVTGADLVAMQIEHARGSLAPLQQDRFALHGAAIECRLYAENPKMQFFPSPGPLDVFALPEPAADLRIEAAYDAGNEITPFYDPLIAKIIVSAATRDGAIARAIEALGALRVEGVTTNRDFLLACLRHPAFADGDVHTGFIAEHAAALLRGKAA